MDWSRGPEPELIECTISDLQARLLSGELTASILLEKYLARIEALDRSGPRLTAVIEINPDAESIARERDNELRRGSLRGPLHGIPVLLKDNIDTADRMMTTAGSLAMIGNAPAQDATVVRQLRAAGAVIMGKTNMSEWANFRSTHSSSGWSGRGGQCKNPYALDRSPSGSSSGSAVATAANLCALAIGTETDGSIVSPANNNGLVGIKPTVGLTSRAGVIPVSFSQDSIGPLTRTVTDAALVLGVISAHEADPQDWMTQHGVQHAMADYTRFLDRDGLRGARIGVAREGFFGKSPHADAITEAAIQLMKDAGAEIVDPADITTVSELGFSGAHELPVLLHEFKAGLNAYLSFRTGLQVKSLADCIAFNQANATTEMAHFGQELFVMAEATQGTDHPAYQAALSRSRRLSRDLGIDSALEQHRLDALVAPAGSPAWLTDLVNGDHLVLLTSSAAAQAGYPLIAVPAGWSQGLPVDIMFMGRAYSESTLIRLAYAFEQASQVRRPPRLLPSIELA